MAKGTILDAARRDNTALFYLFVILTVICGGVIALNWTYVYNFATGPYPVTKALASSPGLREFGRAESALIDTDAQEVSKSRSAGAVSAACSRRQATRPRRSTSARASN